MTKFTFEPFVGPMPLRFGMIPVEVAAFVGAPDRFFSDPFGNRSESRSGFSLGYDADSGQLIEAVFSKCELFYQGENLFLISDVIDFLRKYDDSPQFAVGVIFFLRIGLSLTGFQDGDEDQKSISVTRRGHWDEFLEELIPFKK